MLNKIFDYLLIRRSGLFDERYYLRNYPDVRKADVDPLLHFVMHGWKDGRNPSQFFDTKFYIDNYKDVRDAGINPLIHFIQLGLNEGRDCVPK